jgi:hypothetical protein
LQDSAGKQTRFEEAKEEAGSVEAFFVLDGCMTAQDCTPSNLLKLVLSIFNWKGSTDNNPRLPSRGAQTFDEKI